MGWHGLILGTWPKCLTIALVLYLLSSFSKDQFYYYKNLGIGKKSLLVVTGLIDLFFFILLGVAGNYMR